jgi:hypothetical protein
VHQRANEHGGVVFSRQGSHEADAEDFASERTETSGDFDPDSPRGSSFFSHGNHRSFPAPVTLVAES